MSVSADNEWSPLRSVIVGRAKGSVFPNEPKNMIEATMPAAHQAKFLSPQAFPPEILKHADQELDTFADILKREGVTVIRPPPIDWSEHQGYTCAMPRDGLMTVGNVIIEACFAWRSRVNEIAIGYGEILKDLSTDPSVVVARKPDAQQQQKDSIYDKIDDDKHQRAGWTINDSRPSFDAADFMRFGKTILGQLSHVTNPAGIEHVRSKCPDGYSVELLDTTDSSAMHIDATILPLRDGLLLYQPERVSESALRKHAVFKDWDIRKYPFVPAPRTEPPLFMTSPWLCMNVLVLDGKKVVIEAQDVEFAEWLRGVGMEPIPCAFQHVHSIGGSFHCATVDLVREA